MAIAPALSQSPASTRAPWHRRRPGAGGFLVLLVVAAWGQSNGPSSMATDARVRAATAASAKWLFIIAFDLAVFWVTERFIARHSGDGGALAARFFGRPRWGTSLNWLASGAALGAGTLVAWDLVVPVVDRLWAHGPPGTYNNLPPLHAATIALAALQTTVLVPICEEVLFRGCVQSWLARRLPAWTAIGVATVAFAFAHGVGPGAYNSVQLVGVAGSGLVYGLLFELSGALTPGILAHAAWNGAILWANASGHAVTAPAAMILLGAVSVVVARRAWTGAPPASAR